MALKDVIEIDTELLVKPYLRVEHSADNTIIEMLTKAAIVQADAYLCRDFEAGAGELDNIKLACLQAVAKWYENRGDASKLPPEALEILDLYRFEPGF